MRRTSLAAFAAGMIVVLTSGVGHAQEDGAWRAAFNSAVGSMAEGAFDAAAEGFGEAYRLGGGPSALFNQGVALERAGRMADAFRAFDRVVTEHATELEGEALQDVIGHRRTASEATALIRVTASLAGELTIDDSAAGALEADRPLAVRVDPGARRFVLRWGTLDEASAVEEITVAAGEERELRIAPAVGRLRVLASGAVTIDRAPAGSGLVEVTVRAGSELEVGGPDGTSRRVTVLEGDTQDVDLRPRGDDGLVIGLAVAAAVAVALGAVATGVGVWASEQPGPPRDEPPFGVIMVLRERF